MKKLLIALAILSTGCEPSLTQPEIDLLPKSAFETTIDGQKVELFNIKNRNMAAQITNYGARLVTLFVPSKEGAYKDVVWGYESISAYLSASDKYAGPIVGRYGNRIGKGRFTLDGKEYQLSINDKENHLHGGTGGFSTKVWEGRQPNDSTVVLTYLSADGEEGYPGEVRIEVTYTVTTDCSLKIDYRATTDAPTVINLTNHSYFNLSGSSTDVTTHTLQLEADCFTPTDAGSIPTGEIRKVDETPMDFRTATPIGAKINSDYEPLVFGSGYDHNWIFRQQGLDRVQATLYCEQSGIVMDVLTDQPAIQFYSGNFMDGTDVGKRGDKHLYRSGVALEAQNYPDAPNHSNFPNSVLRPGEEYKQTTYYRFSVR